jgi:hypothetical protein
MGNGRKSAYYCMSMYDPPVRYLIKQWRLLSGIIGPASLLAYKLVLLVTRIVHSISTRLSNNSGDKQYAQRKWLHWMSLWPCSCQFTPCVLAGWFLVSSNTKANDCHKKWKASRNHPSLKRSSFTLSLNRTRVFAVLWYFLGKVTQNSKMVHMYGHLDKVIHSL